MVTSERAELLSIIADKYDEDQVTDFALANALTFDEALQVLAGVKTIEDFHKLDESLRFVEGPIWATEAK